MLHDICSPKKLPPVGGPNSIRKVRFLRFSLERARRRDRRLNECPHAPELLCRQSVGTHLPHAAAQQTTLTPSSTHFFSFLLLVGRRNLPPLRSNWTEARRGGGIAPTSLTQGQTHNTWKEALQWAINSLWKSCHCSTFPNTLFVILGEFDIGTISICTSAHMQLSKASFLFHDIAYILGSISVA